MIWRLRAYRHIFAPVSTPAYQLYLPTPIVKCWPAAAAALALHAVAATLLFALVHDRHLAAPAAEPTLALVIQKSPAVGTGPQAAAQAADQVEAIPAPLVKTHATQPPRPHRRKPAAPAPLESLHPGATQFSGSGEVVGAKIIPARPNDEVNQPPAYPPAALQHGEEGRVLLSIHVLPDGRPDQIDIATSSGFTVLDNAAMTAVMQWQFQPAVQNGKPVASVLPFWVSFRLN